MPEFDNPYFDQPLAEQGALVLNDRLNEIERKLDTILHAVRISIKQENSIMATLDDLVTASSSMTDEVKVASDLLRQLKASATDPAQAAKIQAVSDSLTAAHTALKSAVDSVSASGGLTK